MRISLLIVSGIMTLAFSGAVPSVSFADHLPEINKPTYEVGDKTVGINESGAEITIELIESDEDERTYRRSDGCTWTNPTTGFAPSTSWDDCDGNSGYANVKLWKGQPYPIKLGNKWQYDIDGGNWTDSRHCEVESEEKVTVPLGTYDTYKVVCSHNSNTRTYYVAPSISRLVKYVRTGSRPSSWELKQIVKDTVKR